MKNFNKKGFVYLFIVTLIISSFSFLTLKNVKAVELEPFFTDNSSLKRILLINSYDQDYKWTAEVTQAVQDKLNESGLYYDLEVENMDTKRVNDEISSELIFNQFKYKFSKFEYDIILISDDDAFKFALKYRDDLFPDLPLVFCGVNYLQNRIEIIEGQKLISGVNEDVDIEGSLDIALKLQPEVKNIYFIHDNTTTGEIMGKQLQKIIPKYKDNYNITVYDGSLSGEEIINNIKNISSDSLVYLTLFTEDKNKRYFSFDKLLKEMRAVTDEPIYGTWSWSLGDGIVGGKLVSGYSQGVAMTDIALRVLNGEDINNIPIIMKSPNIYAFDYREIIARDSVRAKIPLGSTIINQPESFYIKYKEYFWGGIALFIILFLFVVVFFTRNRFNLLKLEKSAVQQEKLEKMVAERTVSLEKVNKDLREEFQKTKKAEDDLRKKNDKIEAFNKVMIDRELKMLELKKEIEKFKNSSNAL